MAEFVQSEMKVIKPDEAILGSPESLEKYWEEYCNTQKDDDYCIKEPFLIFPKGTNEFEICEWFNKMYPNGLLELMRKRQIKRFGEDYMKALENVLKRTALVGTSYFLSIPPDLTSTREFQAESRGHRMSIQPVDDAACLTEEDKKRLLKEFAEESNA
jgi:hypothetical protein